MVWYCLLEGWVVVTINVGDTVQLASVTDFIVLCKRKDKHLENLYTLKNVSTDEVKLLVEEINIDTVNGHKYEL